mmetsp:Transcript_9913/g.37373  ORF Transcript_9913/g.37373 Transcript_9913/m.37373 type:complete len:527 (-) Transcript_9913:110-1690(-)
MPIQNFAIASASRSATTRAWRKIDCTEETERRRRLLVLGSPLLRAGLRSQCEITLKTLRLLSRCLGVLLGPRELHVRPSEIAHGHWETNFHQRDLGIEFHRSTLNELHSQGGSNKDGIQLDMMLARQSADLSDILPRVVKEDLLVRVVHDLYNTGHELIHVARLILPTVVNHVQRCGAPIALHEGRDDDHHVRVVLFVHLHADSRVQDADLSVLCEQQVSWVQIAVYKIVVKEHLKHNAAAPAAELRRLLCPFHAQERLSADEALDDDLLGDEAVLWLGKGAALELLKVLAQPSEIAGLRPQIELLLEQRAELIDRLANGHVLEVRDDGLEERDDRAQDRGVLFDDFVHVRMQHLDGNLLLVLDVIAAIHLSDGSGAENRTALVETQLLPPSPPEVLPHDALRVAERVRLGVVLQRLQALHDVGAHEVRPGGNPLRQLDDRGSRRLDRPHHIGPPQLVGRLRAHKRHRRRQDRRRGQDAQPNQAVDHPPELPDQRQDSPDELRRLHGRRQPLRGHRHRSDGLEALS